jgi:hypothetical protein
VVLARVLLSTSTALAVLAAAGLASASPPRVEGSQTGLGVTGPETPVVLQQVAAAPYARSEGASCQELAEQITALDQVLGPDVDAQSQSQNNFGHMAASTIRSLIPYRGVVRLVTGAGRKEEALGQAVLAGTARRGYLRGLRQERGCETVDVAVAVPAAEQAGRDIAVRAQIDPPAPAFTPLAAQEAAYSPAPYDSN